MKKQLTILILFSMSSLVLAQPAYMNKGSKRPNPGDKFLQTQWWLGFKAGTNISRASADASYSGYSPINYNPSEIQKSYADFENLTGQAGLEITFYHKGFSFSFQPNYRRQQFGYSNAYTWQDSEEESNFISLNYDQAHKLDFIELPVFLKYDILKTTKLRPFVQVGFFYGTLVNAQKEVSISGEDRASGGPFENEEFIIGADDLFIKSSIGVVGGVGLYYDFWNLRLVFDVSYRMGLNNLTNAENRFSENQLSGIGDAMDDIMMDNVTINFGCLFPLRFISSGINAVR